MTPTTAFSASPTGLDPPLDWHAPGTAERGFPHHADVEAGRAETIAGDVATVARIAMVPMLLRLLCESTGMGFAAVARVSDLTWTACSVHDAIGFGIELGAQLENDTMLCSESRRIRLPITVERASTDPRCAELRVSSRHPFESYVTYPIVLADGSYFGNLCCIDPRRMWVDRPGIRSMFRHFAESIGLQLDEERRREATRVELLSERAAGELRERSIAVLGHDLRDPLAALSTGAHILRFRLSGHDELRLLGQMLESVKRMAALIDDTIDFAHGEVDGGPPLQLRWSEGVAVAVAIGEAVGSACRAFPGHRILGSVSIDRPVRCDLQALRQMVSILIGHAIALAAVDREISVTARCDADFLRLSVAHQGDVREPAALQHILEPPRPRDLNACRDGQGPGLRLCNRVARRHGGRLTVVSAPPDGTTVVVQLPTAGPVSVPTTASDTATPRAVR